MTVASSEGDADEAAMARMSYSAYVIIEDARQKAASRLTVRQVAKLAIVFCAMVGPRYLEYRPRGEAVNYRPPAPSLYGAATSHGQARKKLPFRPLLIIIYLLLTGLHNVVGDSFMKHITPYHTALAD